MKSKEDEEMDSYVLIENSKSSKALKDQGEKGGKKMTWKRNIKSTHKENVRVEVANSSNAPLSKA